MHSIDTIQSFLGWCAILNITIFSFSALMVVVFSKQVSFLHAKFFNIEKEGILYVYFQYLALYKIFIIVFNIGPYLALELMR